METRNGDRPGDLRSWLFAAPHERHRPPHAADRGIALFITASTLNRERHLGDPQRRDDYRDLLLEVCGEYEIELLAWVLLPEHYHLVLGPNDPEAVPVALRALHRRSTTRWNREAGQPGRQRWYQYWDRSLWTDGDVISRVNYIHWNPVKHGHLPDEAMWSWSSLSSYVETDAADTMRNSLARFPAPRKLPGDDF